MSLKDHEIISILRTLSADDLASIRSMLNSKFFNKRKIVEKTFDSIASFHPDYDSPDFTDHNIILSISEDKIYDKVTLRVNLSIILTVIEKYIILKELDRDPFYKDYFLVNNHLISNRLGLIEKNLRSMDKILKQQGSPINNKNLKQYFLVINELNLMLSIGSVNRPLKDKIIFEKFLKTFTYLINYFIEGLTTNYMSFDMYSRIKPPSEIRNKIEAITKDFDFNKILKTLSKETNISASIELKINMLNAFSRINEPRFYYVYRGNIKKHSGALSGYEQLGHYSKLISYCFLKTKTKEFNEVFSKELFQVCREYTAKKLYTYGTVPLINLRTFRVIFTAAIENDELNWAEHFSGQYYKETNKEYHEDILSYCTAVISFCKGEYSRALELINGIKTDSFYNDMRQIKLLTYYKLGYKDDIRYEIRTFRKYLKLNKTITSETKEEINIFLKQLDLLIVSDKNQKEVKTFVRNLSKEKYFRFKKMLINSLKEPEASFRL